MCKFCKIPKGKRRTEELDMPEIYAHIVGNVVEMTYDAFSTDSSFNGNWEINFCPMCGEKLEKL